MEIKEYRNRLVLYIDVCKSNPALPDDEKEQIATFGKLLTDHGISYKEGKAERIFLANGSFGLTMRHIIHLHLDDCNYTAYKLIKD